MLRDEDISGGGITGSCTTIGRPPGPGTTFGGPGDLLASGGIGRSRYPSPFAACIVRGDGGGSGGGGTGGSWDITGGGGTGRGRSLSSGDGGMVVRRSYKTLFLMRC